MGTIENEKRMNGLLREFLEGYCYEEGFKGNLRPADWQRYYDFIAAAYTVPQGIRPTVSHLSNLFQARKMPESGTLAMLYAHGLYILARFHHLPIFKGGFNY